MTLGGMENAQLFDAGNKGRGLRATKELNAGDVVFSEPTFSAVVFDRYVASTSPVWTKVGGNVVFLLEMRHLHTVFACTDLNGSFHDTSTYCRVAVVSFELEYDVLLDPVFKTKKILQRAWDAFNVSHLSPLSSGPKLVTQQQSKRILF